MDANEKQLQMALFDARISTLVEQLKPEGLSPTDPAHKTIEQLVNHFEAFLDSSK
jgi:hypothetical protein